MALIRTFAALFCGWLVFVGDAFAGGVNIAPTRAIIDDRASSAVFTIYNDDPANAVTYRISLVDQVMSQDGAIRSLDETAPVPEGLHSARALLRVSPPQVQLGPGQSQSIRIAFRPPADLVRGEYRAHMMVSALPKVEPPSGNDPGPRGLAIKLNSIYSVSVPIIVRVGGVSSRPSLQNPKFEMQSGSRGPAMNVDLVRDGDASVFGDVAVYFVPRTGKPEEVGRLRKVAAYTELRSRTVSIALKTPSGGFAPGGRLITRMVADLDEKGAAPLAEVVTDIR